MERRAYTVRAMHCGQCERAIRDGLGGVDGVEAVNPDARTNTVEVRFDPARADDERVRGELAELGFPVSGEAPIDGKTDGVGVARYLLLVVAVAAVAVAGYAGYVLYPRFDPPEPSTGADLVVDALLGYSQQGAPRADIAALLDWAQGRAAVALDTPTGLELETGRLYAGTVHATATVTLAAGKPALRDHPEAVGTLYLGDIGVPGRTRTLVMEFGSFT